MNKIKKIVAREILNALGIPTIETTIVLDNDQIVISSVPTGVSIGKNEAVDLYDQDKTRFDGKGVLKAIANVNEKISPKLIGLNPVQQTKIDQILVDLDGMPNKSNLGANAIFSVSQAILKAGSSTVGLPLYQYIIKKYGLTTKKPSLPNPIFSLINGGLHGAGNLDFQEFHLIASSRNPYHKALQMGSEVYHQLEKVLIHRNAVHSLGDDGGFAPDLFTNADALEIIREAIKQTPYRLGEDLFLGLDVAASFFYNNEKYVIRDKPQPLNPAEMIAYYQKLNSEYHIFYLEDPLWEDDWKNWPRLKQVLGEATMLVGDDLLSTNKERVKKAIKEKACTAILVKPNQVGTISETIEVIKIAHQADWRIVISHRSGETNDDFIADFSVGVNAQYVKFGAPARGERVAKYNRLLKIEEELGFL